jgi:hypothetical protein
VVFHTVTLLKNETFFAQDETLAKEWYEAIRETILSYKEAQVISLETTSNKIDQGSKV